jgi:hypothetical protein
LVSIFVKKKHLNSFIVPATQEAEAGGPLELQMETILGNMSACLKTKKQTCWAHNAVLKHLLRMHRVLSSMPAP